MISDRKLSEKIKQHIGNDVGLWRSTDWLEDAEKLEKENSELKTREVTPRMIEVILDISSQGDENLTSEDIYREILDMIKEESK